MKWLRTMLLHGLAHVQAFVQALGPKVCMLGMCAMECLVPNDPFSSSYIF